MGRVLLVERERDCRALLADALAADGFEVATATDGASAAIIVARDPVDVVVLEIELDLEVALTGHLARVAPGAAVVLLTPSTYLDEALAACRRRGAYDLVLRPFDIEDVSLTVACAAASRGERRLDQALAHVRKNHELLG